ncbi:MAG: hypothetical protein J5711_05410 [Bacteroidales bacterium]|nr:hypothetical protein [Bacteroidales bacterium]
MKNHKKKRKVPLALIAVRKGNREAERELLGDGFHARTHVAKNKKHYSRKAKHRNLPEE